MLRPARMMAALALPAWAALVIPGCGGDDWKAATVPASGKISINGKPPTGLLVQLYPTGAAVDARNSRPWAKVRDDGTYQLTAYEDRDGVPPGDYAVTLVWPVDAGTIGSPDRLARRYDRPEQSPWKVTIRPGEPNTLPPIDLSGVTLSANPRTSAREKAVVTP